MAASDLVVTVTLDSELGQLIADLVPLAQSMEKEIERQRQEIAALEKRIDNISSGLDALANRIETLENLPGVPEVLRSNIRANLAAL